MTIKLLFDHCLLKFKEPFQSTCSCWTVPTPAKCNMLGVLFLTSIPVWRQNDKHKKNFIFGLSWNSNYCARALLVPFLKIKDEKLFRFMFSLHIGKEVQKICTIHIALLHFAGIRVTPQPHLNKFAWNPLDSKQLLDVSVNYYRMYFESF